MEASADSECMDASSLLNALEAEKAYKELQKCCGSRRWARAMAEARPFRDERQLFQSAEAIWRELGPSDWLEAFSHHPRIGDKDALRARFAATAQWAASEQSGAATAPERVLDELAEGNRAYEAKYGHIFIVCATGKSAEEMLGLLKARMDNDPVKELGVAAEEQRKITELRLKKLLESL